MHDDPTRDPSYISQSEGRTAQDCGTRWLAEWHHGVRHSTPESVPQMVGSLGHAVVAEHLLARHEGRDPGVASALIVECERRRYDIDLDDPLMARATAAAETLLASPKFAPGAVVQTGCSVPLIEHRMRATWGDLVLRAGLNLESMLRVLYGMRVGMEGQPDFVHYSKGRVCIDDFKFRQKADLGGAVEQSGLADPQGAFYKVLLAGTGALHGALAGAEVVFRQINVYAGDWLSLTDFLREDSSFVTSHGIPSRDLKVLGMVAPEVWEEAWRVLVERRRVASTLAVTTTMTGKSRRAQVRIASEAEQRDAAAFVDTLRRLPLVEVSEFRLDHTVCVEVVRDMLAAVAGHIALLRAGVRPGRHLRTYLNSPCARRFGCPVQEPCLAALGTFRLEETLVDMAEDGRLRRASDAARHATIADYDITPSEHRRIATSLTIMDVT